MSVILDTLIRLPEMTGIIEDYYPTGREASETEPTCAIQWETNEGFRFVTVERLRDAANLESHHWSLLQQAAKIGESKDLLRKRLNESVSCFNDRWARVFKVRPNLDFAHKRLISRPTDFSAEDIALGAIYTLEWQVRAIPLSPPSYENQQTSVGRTHVRFLSYP